jgi:hypothetical protein
MIFRVKARLPTIVKDPRKINGEELFQDRNQIRTE